MKIKYKQNQPYGCGLYAVANACNLDNFITEERLEKSKTGNVIGQLSKWMQDDGHPFILIHFIMIMLARSYLKLH